MSGSPPSTATTWFAGNGFAVQFGVAFLFQFRDWPSNRVNLLCLGQMVAVMVVAITLDRSVHDHWPGHLRTN